MTTEQLVAKFDPANAANLVEADLLEMRALTEDQIAALAKAYPNQPSRKPYLVLYDNNMPANKQLYALSTWQNFNNVRKFANRKNLIPYHFKELFFATGRPQTSRPQQRNTAPVRKVSVDLSAEQAAQELKSAVAKRAPVTSSARKPEADTATKAAEKKPAEKKPSVKKTAANKPAPVKQLPAKEQAPGDGADTEFTSGLGDGE